MEKRVSDFVPPFLLARFTTPRWRMVLGIAVAGFAGKLDAEGASWLAVVAVFTVAIFVLGGQEAKP
jgi:hypothetical protein